jgi:cell division septation protein DedD
MMETGEFEVVLGKRQAASLTFLALVLVALCSGGSYLIGRSAAPSVATPQEQAEVPDPPPIGAAAAEVVRAHEPPLFDSPLKGPVYIQLGAVDKGVATLLAHGARRLGHSAFVTQGPNTSVFRVLVGPFESAADYDSAQASFKEIGLDNFSRRYQEQ